MAADLDTILDMAQRLPGLREDQRSAIVRLAPEMDADQLRRLHEKLTAIAQAKTESTEATLEAFDAMKEAKKRVDTKSHLEAMRVQEAAEHKKDLAAAEALIDSL